MRVGFQHANPAEGNESVLLRFVREGAANACVLVDAGAGVDLDALFGPDDRLAAVLLTHAHLDHYGSLAENHRSGAPVYASPATAAILPSVLAVAREDCDAAPPADLLAAVTPVDAWTEVAAGVRVRPVPAGHAPGAVGFLLRFADDAGDEHTVALTGDFTLEHAAGRRGFPTDPPADVEALFLTGATNGETAETLGRALGTALERARGGARTLVTASGLTGIHVAYLLSRLSARIDRDERVVLVGQVAKLYDALGRDFPGVESVPVFCRPAAVLSEGTVTVAGPEVPCGRSSGRLFDELADDPGACVVQLVGSGRSPVESARCTVHDYAVSNHASEDDLARLVEALDPGEVVVTHVHEGARGQYNDLTDGVVWGKGDTVPATLYADGAWRTPPWMSTDRLRGEFGAAAEPEQSDGGSVVDLAPDPDATLADEPIALGPFDEAVRYPSGRGPGAVEMSSDGGDRTASETLYETTGTADDPSVALTDHLRDPPAGGLMTAYARTRLGAADAGVDSPPADTASTAPVDDPPDETDAKPPADAADSERTLADLCPPVDPLVVDLTAHAAANRPEFPDDPAGVLDAAAERYLERRLSNEPHPTDRGAPALSLAGSDPLVDALTEALSAGDSLCVDRALRAGLRATLARDAPAVDPTEVAVLRRPMLAAVAEADDTGFESVADVLSAAVLDALGGG